MIYSSRKFHCNYTLLLWDLWSLIFVLLFSCDINFCYLSLWEIFDFVYCFSSVIFILMMKDFFDFWLSGGKLVVTNANVDEDWKWCVAMDQWCSILRARVTFAPEPGPARIGRRTFISVTETRTMNMLPGG